MSRSISGATEATASFVFHDDEILRLGRAYLDEIGPKRGLEAGRSGTGLGDGGRQLNREQLLVQAGDLQKTIAAAQGRPGYLRMQQTQHDMGRGQGRMPHQGELAGAGEIADLETLAAVH
jgi:hypothetical protein